MKKQIPGYEGKYWIDREGNVYNMKGQRIKPWLHKGRNSEYSRVTLYGGKVRKKFNARVHRLVALVFIPNPKNKPEVDHINGNTFDNRVQNLRWVTSEENSLNRVLD